MSFQADLKPLFEAKPGKTVDTTDPTVGTPALSDQNITDTSFEITYTKATDNEPDSELEYFLYTSLTDNLNNKNTIESNGTLQDQGTDVALLIASGLTPEQQYYRNVLVKDQAGNKEIYTAGTTTTIAATAGGEDSQAGDEAWAEALSASVTGLDATWNTPIDFDSQVPTGLIVVGGRVSEIDLRYEGLGGSLDIPEWENLKQCTRINTAHNSFDTQYPNAIHRIGSNLEHLQLNYSDHSLEEESYPANYPDEYAEIETPGHIDPGKDSGTGNSIFRGSVGADINNLTGLKSFLLSFTDDFGANSRTPNAINGIESLPSTIWDLLPTLEYLQFYDNWNVAEQGNTFSFPASMGGVDRPLKQVFLGGGNGTTWDRRDQGFMVGSYPSDLGLLTNIKTWWVERNPDLSGFPDMTGSPGLISLLVSFTDLTGSFPTWMQDNSKPDLDSFVIAFPQGAKMSGTIDSLSSNMSKIDNFDIADHNFSGSVPTELWDLDPNKINLGINNFTSLGTTDLSGLVSMSTLRWYRNDVEGEQIPDLDWGRLTIEDVESLPGSSNLNNVVHRTSDNTYHRWNGSSWDQISDNTQDLSTQFNQIRFEENRYVPRDMLYIPPGQAEPALDLYKQLTLSVFSYGNQKPAGTTNSYSPNAGNTLVISDFNGTYSHADNVYQWQKNGSDISNGAKYSGVDTKELTITDPQSADDGNYELVVTNPGIPGETFKSQPITVTVN